MLDFLYFGEANIAQEKLENFLAIASELELEGLANQNFKDEHTIIKEELETGTLSKEVHTKKQVDGDQQSCSESSLRSRYP